MFLFYFGSQNTEQGNESCAKFVEEFQQITKGELTVFLESAYDYDFLTRYFSGKDRIRFAEIYREINTIHLDADTKERISKEYNRINFNKYYLTLKRNILNDTTYDDLICKHIIFFERFLSEHTVRCIHFGINQMFRSLGILILHELAREKKIRFFMIYNTPVKGRHFVYENIYHQPRTIENEYLDLLDKGISKEVVRQMDAYFEAYRTFKKETHKERFSQKWKGSRKEAFSFRKLQSKLINAGFTLFCRRRYVPFINRYTTDKPFVLLLLNKTNNWLTNYGLPYYADVPYLAKVIWLSMPLGHSLIIKDHPLISFPNLERIGLYELARKVPEIHYLYGEEDTRSLVQKASIVVYNCSTSGVEALMEFKHVITFGKHPVFFDFPKPPVHRVSCVEDLPDIIHECLTTPPPRDKIYAYFYKLLEKSESYHGEEDINYIDFTQDEAYFRNLAHFLYRKIKENGIV